MQLDSFQGKDAVVNMTIRRMVGWAAAAVVMALGLSACSQQQLVGFATGRTPHHASYWVIAADTSGSTDRQTQLGGAYEQEIMAALVRAAQEQATVYAAAIDGNAVADAGWTINGVALRSEAGGGNAQLAAAARVQLARGLRPRVRALLRSRPTNGSDILDGLLRVAQLGRDLPVGAPKTLVVVSDGAVNIAGFGGYDAYSQPPDSPAVRHGLIAQFRRGGELPRLRGWRVYLGGIGVGIGNRSTARGVIALWEELIPAMGAKLAAINSTLAFG